MTRLNLIVEGETEESFVKGVLTPFLSSQEVFPVARLVETSRKRGQIYRGGLVNELGLIC